MNPPPSSFQRLHHLVGIPQYTNIARILRYILLSLTVGGLSGWYHIITCRRRRFRKEYLDGAEALPVYI